MMNCLQDPIHMHLLLSQQKPMNVFSLVVSTYPHQTTKSQKKFILMNEVYCSPSIHHYIYPFGPDPSHTMTET